VDYAFGGVWLTGSQNTNQDGRPFYFIRPYVPVFTVTGVERRKHSIPLGFVNEIIMREAKARKQQMMATINAGKFVFQSQIAFRELVERFLALHVPTLGSATRENYQTQIKNHILPAFGDLRLCDITRTIVGTWLNAKAAAHEVTTRLPGGSEITKTCPPLSWWSRSQVRGILSWHLHESSRMESLGWTQSVRRH
jgi:Phage integrase, N-terminal SAM-like domain